MNQSTPEKSLKSRIIDLVHADGPIPLSVFMQLALYDRRQGYYATRPGVGQDFTTAPEVSQVFGELLGLWAANEWRQLGSPTPFNLVELGPGRGVMMADIWRATKSIPGFHDAANLILIDPSLALRTIQAERLEGANPVWADGLDEIDDQPSLILANEVLDCLPIRQFVRKDKDWHEKLVGLSDKGELQLGLSPTPTQDPPAIVQDAAEVSPALEAMVEQVAEKLKASSGRALFIDYGPANAVPGDTLRAYRQGEQVDPIAMPGEADLTADVDFSAVKRLAIAHNLDADGPTPQGLFLAALGGEARVNALINANPENADHIIAGATKIMAPEDMGERFKAICLSSPDLPTPAGF